MADEIKKVLTIEVNGDQTVKSLKQEINDLRDALLNTEEGSEEYKKVLEQLIEDQKKLTSVMSVGKKEVEAAAGSYNALQIEMTALKKVWREVTDEASRSEIGARIYEINEQLKGMDASIGVFSRNVGDYEGAIVDATKNIMQNLSQISPELGGLGKTINQMIPIIQKTTKVATTGLKGIKKAIVSTGIGALVVALGILIANWDKLSEAISKVIPWQKKSREETEKLIEKNEQLITTNKEATEEIEYQARILAAQGKTQLEIIQFKKQETEAILANTNAQIEETNAKIASIKAHSAFGRWIRGEKKQLKGLEESLESLTKEQESITKTLKKFNQDIVVEETKLEYERSKAASGGTKSRIEISEYESKSRLAILQDYIEKAKVLEEGFYTDEQKNAKEFADNQDIVIKGLYANILKSIKETNIPQEINKVVKQISSIKLPESLREKIENVIGKLDLTKTGEDITNDLRKGLDKIDLSGLSNKVQTEFKNLINTLEVNEISSDLADSLNSAFSNVEFTDIIESLREIFGDNEEMNELFDSFTTLWTKVQEENDKNLKELENNNAKTNAERVKDNLNSLKKDYSNKLAYAKEETENEKLKAKELYDTNQQTYSDKIALRQAQYDADKKYSDMEIQALQDELDAYRKAVEEEQLDDETLITFKQEITDREIELIRKLREERDKEREKQKEDAADEKAEIQEKLNTYLEFANAVSSVLGSVADYWAETLNAQVENGKKSEAQAEKEFKWIKGLQIAEATINTIAGAIGAYMKAAEAYKAPWGIIIGATQAAAVTATGMAQIAKIKNTQFSKNASSAPISSGSQVRTITTDYTPQYVAAQTGASETTNLANAMSQQNLFVSVVDINRVQNKVRVREQESQW